MERLVLFSFFVLASISSLPSAAGNERRGWARQASAGNGTSTNTTTPYGSADCPTLYAQAPSYDNYTLQCGVDHYGGDLAHADAGSFQDCFPQCDAIGPTCLGFSYVGGAGSGTCYFKSTIEPAETNANVDFAGRGGPIPVPPPPPPPAPSANTTANITAAPESTSTCSTTSCTSTAEPSAAPGTCRAGHEAFQNNTLSNGYIIYCSQDSSYPSYKTVPVQTGGFTQCFSACDSDEACVGWTYSGTDGGNCYLKSGMGSLDPSTTTIVSGFRPGNSTSSSSISSAPLTSTASSSLTSATPTPRRDCSQLAALGNMYLDRKGTRYKVQCNTDYAGYNLNGPPAASYEDCFTICDQTPTCVAFSYLGGSSPGNCYLKDGSELPYNATGVDSAVLISSFNSSSSVSLPSSTSMVGATRTGSYPMASNATTASCNCTTTVFQTFTVYGPMQVPPNHPVSSSTP